MSSFDETKDQAPIKKQWTDYEALVLLRVWGEPEMQARMLRCRHKRKLWQEISENLQLKGIKRDWQQCFYKIHNMTVEHQKFKCGRKKSRPFIRHFDLFDQIIESRLKTSKNLSNTDGFRAGTIPKSYSACSNNKTNCLTETPFERIQSHKTTDGDGIELKESESTCDSESEPTSRKSLHPGQAKSTCSISSNDVITENITSEYIGDTLRVEPLKPVFYEDQARHNVFMSSLSLLMDKMKEMQRESEERFYAFEEKRLRLQCESEQCRHQRALDHDAQRSQFCAQLVTSVTKSFFETHPAKINFESFDTTKFKTMLQKKP